MADAPECEPAEPVEGETTEAPESDPAEAPESDPADAPECDTTAAPESEALAPEGEAPASITSMGQFCWGVAVGAWGQCTASWGQYLTGVFGKGGQHSGCVNAYEGGTLIHSWVCSPTNEWAVIGFNGARYLVGTVKNNTASSNVLYGEMWW
jgi:hypothetical protein